MIFLQPFGLGCGWCANTRVVHGHMSTKVGSCWIYWRKRVGSLKPCSSKGRIHGQRASESNLGKGFSLLLATFKVFPEQWSATPRSMAKHARSRKDLTSRQPFQDSAILRFSSLSPERSSLAGARQQLHLSDAWRQPVSIFTAKCFGCCRDLAQQLEPILLSCAVTADVDELVLCRGLTIRRPFHLPNAPTTVRVWGGVMD